MTALTDFNDLASAQAYEETSYTSLSAGTVMTTLATLGLYSFVKSSTDEVCVTVYDALIAGQPFTFDPNTADGASVIEMFENTILNEDDEFTDDMVTAISALYATLISKAKTTTTPFADVTQEEFDMATGASEQTWSLSDNQLEAIKYTMELNSAPSLSVPVYVEAALSKDNETWSNWIRVASFGVVTEDNWYETRSVTVPATTAPYRKLRAVSAINLDAEVS